MTTIYFVRHGEYKNPDKIVPWRLPHFPLSAKGRADIEKDAEYFLDKNISVIYSSPVLRTKQSARIIANKLNKKLIISTLISEVYTPLQYRRITYEELLKKRTYPFFDDFHIKNGGESFDDIFRRVNKLVNLLLNKYQGKNIILISHGDPITIYKMNKENLKVDNESLMDGKDYIPKAGIIRFEFKGRELLSIEKINY